MTPRSIAAALAALLASSPVAALAAPSPGTIGVVAVAEPPGPGAELADLSRALRASLAASTPGVVSPDELRLRMEGGGSAASLSELDRAYTGAVAALQAGDVERAARTLRSVAEDLERLPPGDRAFAAWSRSMMRLARAEGMLGRKAEARVVLERLLRADPTASADPELYPPSFVRQVDELRAELRAKPRRKLLVTAGGAAARVYVDGRFVGEAPVTVSIAPGRYRVAGVTGETATPASSVDLSSEDQTLALDFSVAQTLRPAAGPGLALSAAARASGVVGAGAALMLDRVFAVSVAADGDVRYLVGTAYDVQKGMLVREGRVRLSGAAPSPQSLGALAGFLVTGEASSLVDTRPATRQPQRLAVEPEEPGTPSRGSAMLRWSPVVTGGLAVLFGLAATGQAVAANQKYDDARGMLLPNGALSNLSDHGAYQALVDEGDAARQKARGAAVGAATMLGTTAILSYVSYKRTGEIGPFRF
jgi:hypothetical protein